MVNHQRLAAAIAERNRKLVDALQSVIVKRNHQVSHLKIRLRESVLAVVKSDFIGVVHPLQKVGKIVWHHHFGILSLAGEVFIHGQRGADSVTIGTGVAGDHHIPTLIEQFPQLAQFIGGDDIA